MWYELTLTACLEADLEPVSDLLESIGALSISLSDPNDEHPLFEPPPGETPVWPKMQLTALFDEEQKASIALQILKAQHGDAVLDLSIIQDADWVNVAMQDLTPLSFGNRLVICQRPEQITDQTALYAQQRILIPPGLGFGTGTHPTTNLCLDWLSQQDLTNKTLIDYGCGSGILALAALKLGADKAYAVDIDPQALEATRNNAITNQIDPAQLAVLKPDALMAKTSILMANILLNPLISLKEIFKACLNTGGTLVVSGILKEQIEPLSQAYRPDLMKETVMERENWALVVFRA